VTGAPLTGVRVLVPRAAAQAPALSARIRALGGEPVEAPVLTIEPGDDAALRAAVRDLAAGTVRGWSASPRRTGWMPSPTRSSAEGLDARAYAGAEVVACVGSGTARRLWQRCRVRPTSSPTGRPPGRSARRSPPGPGSPCCPGPTSPTRSSRAPHGQGLRPRSRSSPTAPAPGGVGRRRGDRARGRAIDLIALASPSTVRNLVALLGDRPWTGRLVSIGPVTSAACEELGLDVVVEADPHDLDGLVAALVRAGQTVRQAK
jgi:hypothetical protein